jgi:carbonic anhydrase
MVLIAAPVGLMLAAHPATVATSGQSPIDLATRDAAFTTLPAPRFDDAATTSLSVVNTGSPDEEATIRADVPASAGRIFTGDVAFERLRFQFRAEAEHAIDGRRAGMGPHQAHRAANRALAVIGRPVKAGPFNEALAPYVEDLPQHPDAVIDAPDFALSALVPGRLGSWRYEGSLATPPFTEGVQWIVLAEPLLLSQAQIVAFKALFPRDNLREVQPLNGGRVLTDVALVPLRAGLPLAATAVAALGLAPRRRQRAPRTLTSAG